MLRALDLFCGAGGATRGLQMAGFHVTGVDIKPQPRYCGDAFIQADVMDLCAKFERPGPDRIDLDEFDFIWASPPCQRFTALQRVAKNAEAHDDNIYFLRNWFLQSRALSVIENVPGAPLFRPLLLCGSMFNLSTKKAQLRRHRLFECDFPVNLPYRCRHKSPAIGIYGGHVRNRKRVPGAKNPERGEADFSIKDAQQAMGIDWMTLSEMSQAIPPAYSEFIGKAALDYIRAEAA